MSLRSPTSRCWTARDVGLHFVQPNLWSCDAILAGDSLSEVINGTKSTEHPPAISSRVAKGALAFGQIVGGAQQVSTGAKMCGRGYGVGCIPEAVFLVRGVGNLTEAFGNGAEAIDGRERDWNVGKMFHSWWTKKTFGEDYGRQIFIGADAEISGAALKRATRQYFTPLRRPSPAGVRAHKQGGRATVFFSLMTWFKQEIQCVRRLKKNEADTNVYKHT